jgi:DNA polymerase III subunit beta
MKFTSLKENLKKALSIVGHISIKNINLPILNNVLIKTYQNNEIELISTNLEIGIIYKMRSKVEKIGEFTVDSKIINNYISLLPGEKVDIEQSKNEIIIKSDNYKTKIIGEKSDEFPLIPIIKKDEEYCILDLDVLKEALNMVSFSSDINNSRPELAGVLFVFNKNNELVLASTDSYRLSEKKIKIKKNNFKDKKIIVPIKTIQELLRILNNINNEDKDIKLKEIKIYLSDNQILFNIDSIDLISRLIDGSYPDYQQIIPDNFLTTIKIKKEEIVRAVKTSSLFVKKGVDDILLKFLKNKINISSSSGQTGESDINLLAEIEGKENEVLVNYRYLLDGLNNLNSDEVVFKIVDPQTPFLLKSEKDDNYLYLIMPIRG